MNEVDLNKLLRTARNLPDSAVSGPDFTDSILARLPRVRFVIPGSSPGRRILVVAGVLGLLSACFAGLLGRQGPTAAPPPPPLVLFQPGAVEAPAVPAP